jgi:NADPH:quinone reductase-like Zn-dependent oxidoreductase
VQALPVPLVGTPATAGGAGRPYRAAVDAAGSPSGDGLALVVEAFGGLPAVRRRPVPVAAPGETVVRVRAAQVAHLDSDVVAGTFGLLPPLPFVPGTEAAGVVVTSASLPVGTRVRVRGGGVGTARDGTWATHVLAPDTAVTPLPDGVDDAIACCAFSPLATAWAAVHDVAAVRPGQQVLVTGAAGAVGSVAVQLAAEVGAAVTGWVSRPEKLAHVPESATAVVVAEAGPAERVFDAVVDTVGGPVLVQALTRVAPGGTVLLVGYTAGRRVEVDLQALMLADVSLRPINLIRRTPGLLAAFDSLLPRLARGELVLPVERHPATDVATALDRLRSGRVVGKAVIEMPEEPP